MKNERSNAASTFENEYTDAVPSAAETAQQTSSLDSSTSWTGLPDNTSSQVGDSGDSYFAAREPERKRAPGRFDRQRMKELCVRIVGRAERVRKGLAAGELDSELESDFVEIESLLEQLYDCQWGHIDTLKQVVVMLQSQVADRLPSEPLLAFLSDFVSFLATRHVIDDYVIEQCHASMEQYGLDLIEGLFDFDEDVR